jgi:hypothetical protein
MDRVQQMAQILELSGTPPEKAQKLAEVFDSLYGTMSRPNQTVVEKKLDEVVSKSGTINFHGEIIGEEAVNPLRKCIRELLLQFFLGLVTNASWDAMILFSSYLGTWFLADEKDKSLAKSMVKLAARFNQALEKLPNGMPPDFLEEMHELWENQLIYIDQLIQGDPEVIAFCEEMHMPLDFLSFKYEFWLEMLEMRTEDT